MEDVAVLLVELTDVLDRITERRQFADLGALVERLDEAADLGIGDAEGMGDVDAVVVELAAAVEFISVADHPLQEGIFPVQEDAIAISQNDVSHIFFPTLHLEPSRP